jgi:hypothetical protein
MRAPTARERPHASRPFKATSGRSVMGDDPRLVANCRATEHNLMIERHPPGKRALSQQFSEQRRWGTGIPL